jgi:MATE family multidrug resistance protein
MAGIATLARLAPMGALAAGCSRGLLYAVSVSIRARSELAQTLSLAWPVVVAELGWMFMGVIDTLMVGRLSPEAIGAVGLGSSVYLALAIFGMGLLLGLDTFVAQAFGAGRLRDCHQWLLQGIYLGAIMTPPLIVATLALAATMPSWGLHPAVLALSRPYLEVVAWSTPPLMLYAAFRRYLQAVHLVRPVMIVLVTANLVNVAMNWTLIFGHLGFPALGTAGAAWATVLARTYMAVALALVIVLHERRARVGLFDMPLAFDAVRARALLRLGLPAATHMTAEVGAFAAATALAGRLDPVALAAHQIAINVASVTYMVPLGVAAAGAVRVGHAVGRRDAAGVGRAGWTALAVGVGFMALAALAMVLVPAPIISLFTTDGAVVATGVSLLFIGAAFQLFDGLQSVATGVLRGLGDTHTAMLSNIAGHWIIGLPAGALLCFRAGWGVRGLWVGLSIGLILVAIALVAKWHARARDIRAALVPVLS